MKANLKDSMAKETLPTINRLIALALILCAVAILVVGLFSYVSLGDEIHHYRFAKDCFNVGGRAIHDSLFRQFDPVGFYYETEPLWPLTLSFIWRLMGQISSYPAQIYHFCFYLLLIGATYGIAKEMFQKEYANWSALIIGSIPMITSFSILFYLDVPATALSIVSFLFLYRRQYFYAGIFVAFSLLMKRSAAFFLPAFYALILYRGFRQRATLFRSLIVYTLAPMLLTTLDVAWKKKYLQYTPDIFNQIIQRVTSISGSSTSISSSPIDQITAYFKTVEYTHSHWLNLIDLAKYFGVVLSGLILLYVIFKRANKKDFLLWIPLTSYFCLAVLMRLLPDIRYLLPITPYLAILASKVMVEKFQRPLLQGAIIILCLLQCLGASLFTFKERLFPRGLIEGFQFIRNETPQNALILYPETNIMEYTNRRMVWTRFNLQRFFWAGEDYKMAELLRLNLGYIAIKNKRIYDDRHIKLRHVGKYPQSFVRWIDQWPYANKIFSNEDLTLYQIDLNRIKQAP